MKLKDELVPGTLLAAAAGAWLAPPPWSLGDPEARYALEARGLFLGHSEPLGEPVPVLGALLGLLLAGDSDFAVRPPGMLTGAALAALAWGLATELGRPRALGLAPLWTFSPVLALAGRTVGPTAWVNLLTALGAFGPIRWAGTGRRSFLFLGDSLGHPSFGVRPGRLDRPRGVGGGRGPERAGRRIRPDPSGRDDPARPGNRGEPPRTGAGDLRVPRPHGRFPPTTPPVSVLLAVYEPLPLGAWLLGLPKLRLDLRSGWPSALGVIWPLTADRPVGLGAGWFWAPSCWGRPVALRGLRFWEPLGRLRPVFLT